MRRFLPKRCLLLLVASCFVLGIVYIYLTWRLALSETFSRSLEAASTKDDLTPASAAKSQRVPPAQSASQSPFCLGSRTATTDMDTAKILPSLKFEAAWISRREFWSEMMQKRYVKNRRTQWAKQPLEVILMPHSHNDPGWLKTAEGYFNADTKQILNNVVDKLTKYKSMTFVWTEVYFLSMWWNTAHSSRRANLKALVSEGRFEVLTGGWVMTDEANVDAFAMVDQLIEGHSWLRSTLGVSPTSSWSVDPFGHGGTFPYILKSSGVDNMVIMRIHYAWKEFFAEHRTGDFLWSQRWDPSGKHSILCHNFPYDIYSIKGSCGPQSDVCLQYNFASKAMKSSLYDQYSASTKLVTPSNVEERADLLLDQYGKTGSLFPHNVVLVPIGEDFLYRRGEELDAQFTNYAALAEHVNAHSGRYRARMRFGTLKDYFEAVRSRTSRFPTLNGDFFVYSDVFSEGFPAYWSGYFTTRPFVKRLCRQLEAKLRSAEVLFSLAFHADHPRRPELAKAYGALVVPARRSLALFQHHDAITGTSKQFVMEDYGRKLFDGMIRSDAASKFATERLMELEGGSLAQPTEKNSFDEPPKPIPLDVSSGDAFVMVFNSLANDKVEAVSFVVDARVADGLCIVDPNNGDGKKLLLSYQVNPAYGRLNNGDVAFDAEFVGIAFMARLPALSLSKFKVFVCKDELKDGQEVRLKEKTQVYCWRGRPLNNSSTQQKLFDGGKVRDGGVQIESDRFRLSFDQHSRRLNSIEDKLSGLSIELEVEIAGYRTQQFRNGAYLFARDRLRHEEPAVVFDPVSDLVEVLIVSGPVSAEIALFYANGELEPRATLQHTVRLYQDLASSLSAGVYVENALFLGEPSTHRDVDVFMRLKAKGMRNDAFFTDQNGFQMQKRKKVPSLDVNGNIYPITNMAYIQEDGGKKRRLTVVVDHAAAATSWRPGWLEVFMDRRASADDGRGMGEGVQDNVDTVHNYWILLEESPDASSTSALSLPTKAAQFLSRRLNFPSEQFVGKDDRRAKTPSKTSSRFLSASFPCDLHLFNLRTVSGDSDKPSNASLLLLHSSSSSFCRSNETSNAALDCDKNAKTELAKQLFSNLEVSNIFKTKLTGGQPEAVEEIQLPDPMTINTHRLVF